MKRRNTQSKIEVMNLLKDSKTAYSHEMIKEGLSVDVDRATIYRILNSFYEDGNIHKIIADDGKQYFAWCTASKSENHTHDHFHFRCTICGIVECLDGEVAVNLPNGYQSQKFNGILSGTCNRC